MKLAIHQHIEGIVITALDSSGAVEAWNESFQSAAEGHSGKIQVGHVILVVNGFRDHRNMKQQLETSESVELQICRVRNDLQDWALKVSEQRQLAIDAVAQKAPGMSDQEEACCICHEQMRAKVVQLPCRHHFHESCIKRWLLTGNRCPLCNYELELE